MGRFAIMRICGKKSDFIDQENKRVIRYFENKEDAQKEIDKRKTISKKFTYRIIGVENL